MNVVVRNSVLASLVSVSMIAIAKTEVKNSKSLKSQKYFFSGNNLGGENLLKCSPFPECILWPNNHESSVDKNKLPSDDKSKLPGDDKSKLPLSRTKNSHIFKIKPKNHLNK